MATELKTSHFADWPNSATTPGRGAVTREEALDARGVVRDFLEALANVSATIGAAARDGAKEVAGLAVQLDRLRPPPALTRGARWGRSRPARAGR